MKARLTRKMKTKIGRKIKLSRVNRSETKN
jgi:hypothetical protein